MNEKSIACLLSGGEEGVHSTWAIVEQGRGGLGDHDCAEPS